MFFRGYTQKQWGRGLEKLKAGVAARIPVRFDDDDRYFSDIYQFMPAQGYTALFSRMLDHQNIKVELAAEHSKVALSDNEFKHIIYTGPIDAYFNYSLGHLPYRSLKFEHYHLAEADLAQSVAVYNYPKSEDYTRTTEFKHMTGQKGSGTSLVKEYPTSEGDPYYPIPSDESEALFQQYKSMADEENNVTFVGRLAQYRYYNMDQVVAAAMHSVEEVIKKLLS
jgi:UDP-galactopyranose mutase